MKLFHSSSAATILLAPLAVAQAPSCAWDCFQQGGSGICTDSSILNTFNACVASSSDCSDADRETIYQAAAQICVNANPSSTITAAPEATFSATAGGSNYPASWSNQAWGPWQSAFPVRGGYSNVDPWGFASASGAGPWAGGGPLGGGWGPWGSSGRWTAGTWSEGPWSEGPWTTGPWTSWWGRGDCPGSTWPGWTAGSWSSEPPWTSWAGCTATTTATTTYTTSIPGRGTYVSVAYGVQVAQATEAPSAPSVTGTSSTNGANGGPSVEIAFGTFAAAMLALFLA